MPTNQFVGSMRSILFAALIVNVVPNRRAVIAFLIVDNFMSFWENWENWAVFGLRLIGAELLHFEAQLQQCCLLESQVRCCPLSRFLQR